MGGYETLIIYIGYIHVQFVWSLPIYNLIKFLWLFRVKKDFNNFNFLGDDPFDLAYNPKPFMNSCQ